MKLALEKLFRPLNAIIPLVFLAGCNAGNDQPTALVETTAVAAPGIQAPPAVPPTSAVRLQDSLVYTLDPASLPFGPMQDVAIETDRWSGVLNGAGYRIEVPRNWNGRLVLYAHGYEGLDPALSVSDPPMRRHLIQNGYAWAASTFSKNGYDVRAGVEDTNALALAFTTIAAQNNRPLPPPARTYIVGASMGGHIAAAAVERETLETAVNKFRYNAAMSMCGVVGDTELFNYLAAYQLAAQYLAGLPAPSFPDIGFAGKKDEIKDNLWRIFPLVPKDEGRKLSAAVINLTGGPRPIAADSFRLKPLQDPIWARFGSDGTIDGIVNSNIVDTTGIVYQLDGDPALSDEERLMNATILQVRPTTDVNPRRSDGLRWVPKVNGQFDVPVVTLHTLGDLAVPFSMQQIYKRRAAMNGSDQWLVQRAIRSPGHCDFTLAEQVEAFEAMVNWEQLGVRPAGDDVLNPGVVANPDYGCTFTRNIKGPDDSSTLEVVRKLLPSCS